MIEIFNEIVSEFSTMERNKTPISDMGIKYKFSCKETENSDEFYRAELIDKGQRIVISIYGSDHSGELQNRKDTYHNCIEYYNSTGECVKKEYMYVDD